MKRISSVALTLVLNLPLIFVAACTSGEASSNSNVDINAAAVQAQGAVDAYGADTANSDAVAVAETDAAPDAENVGAGPSENTALAPLDPPAPGTPGGLADDRTPVSEASFTPDSAQGAANVVQTYYALIGEGKFAQAFALRDGAGGPADPAAFAADFARYSEYHANIGAPGAMDAGAGQRNVTVPVQIYARLKRSGIPVYQIGSVTLHRTGDVDGASAAQRNWHIRTVTLEPAPKR